MKRRREKNVESNGCNTQEPSLKKQKLGPSDSEVDEKEEMYTLRKDFELSNILKFINECKVDAFYVHFDSKDVQIRKSYNNPTTLYVDDGNTEKPGFYCSLVSIQTELLNAGYSKKRLIPSQRIRDFKTLAKWVKVWTNDATRLPGLKFISDNADAQNGNESDKIHWTSDEEKGKILTYYKDKPFCLTGIMKLFGDLKIPSKYVNFDEEDSEVKPTRLYFDDKTEKNVGFFCDIEDVRRVQAEYGILKQEEQIPKKRLHSYLEVVEYAKYLEIYNKNFCKEELERRDEYKPPETESEDDEEFVKTIN